MRAQGSALSRRAAQRRERGGGIVKELHSQCDTCMQLRTQPRNQLALIALGDRRKLQLELVESSLSGLRQLTTGPSFYGLHNTRPNAKLISQAMPSQSSTRYTELTPFTTHRSFSSFFCSGISHAFCRSTSDCTQRDWMARIIRTGKHSRIQSQSCTLLKCIETSIDSGGQGKGGQHNFLAKL